MSARIELVGGPHDGTVFDLPDRRPPDVWLMPAPADLSATIALAVAGEPPSVSQSYVYALGHDQSGFASINDAGTYRFRFGGLR